MKKALFIDRDGTIIREPADEQIDSVEKFRFVDGAISGMKALMGLGYELVLASNQDGLGTPLNPLEKFEPLHQLLLDTLAAEGVYFDDQLIDPTMPEDNAPTRKPGIGMFTKYLNGDYDLTQCYVIGDRLTDMQLAKNLGCKGLLLKGYEPTAELTWTDIVKRVRMGERSAEVKRTTKETDIRIFVSLDGGESHISTGLHFFDHMLEQLVTHGGLGLIIEAKGDLDVDEHHTIEDVGIALGEALRKALAAKVGINRYGFALPMDESEALVLLDLGGRIDFAWDVAFDREYTGDVPTEMWKHFFQSVCNALQCNLHVRAYGDNCHHKIEAVFKAFARTLRQAVHADGTYEIPSSKAML